MVKRQISKKYSSNVRRRSVRSNKQEGGSMMNVKLRNQQTGKIVKVQAPDDATVKDLKNRIADQLLIQNPESIKLSMELQDSQPLKSYGINWTVTLNLNYENKNEQEQNITSEDDFEY